jgi:hypothetical protein
MASEQIVTELTIDSSGAQRGQADYVSTLNASEQAINKLLAANDKYQLALTNQQRTMDLQVQATKQVTAANSDLSRSMSAANDNVQSAGKGFLSAGVDFATATNHLKLAALGAYALVPAFRSFVNSEIGPGIKLITTTIGTIAPTAAAAGGAITSALMPALAFLSAIAIPVAIGAAAIVLFGKAVSDGADRIKELNDVNNEAAKLMTNTTFWQQQKKGAEDMGISVENLTAMFTKFNEISQPKLGGSDLQKSVDALTAAGNFQGNSGVAELKAATDLQSRWTAITDLITEAINKGERLAALDIAAKFMPPGVLVRQKQSNDLLDQLRDKATEAAAPFDLIAVAVGVSLQSRLDAAKKTIADFKVPMLDLTSLGLVIWGQWINIVETFASALGWVDKLIEKIGNGFKDGPPILFTSDQVSIGALILMVWGGIVGYIQQIPNLIPDNVMSGFRVISQGIKDVWDGIVAGIAWVRDHTPSLPGGTPGKDYSSLAPTEVPGVSLVQVPPSLAALDQTIVDYNDINKALDLMAKNTKAVAVIQGTANASLKDTSQPIVAGINAERDAFDKAVVSIEKHIGALAAESLTIGQSVGAIAGMKTEFQLLEAAKEADKEATDAQKTTWDQQIAAYTTLRATMSSKQALDQSGIELTDAQRAAFLRLPPAIDASTQSYEKLKVASQISFDRQTALLSPQDVQIAQQLKGIYGNDIPAALNSSEAAQIRFNTALKDVGTQAGTFASGFALDLSHGVQIMTALQTATQKLADTLIDMAAKQLMSTFLSGAAPSLLSGASSTATQTAGATSAATILTTAGASVAASFVSGATAAASILGIAAPAAGGELAAGGAAAGVATESGGILAGITTALGGTTAGAALVAGGMAVAAALEGPLGIMLVLAAAAVGFSFIESKQQKYDQAEQAFQQAQDSWAKMAIAVAAWTATMQGNVVGTLGSSLASATAQAQTYADAAHAAGRSSDQLQASLETFAVAAATKFVGSFDVMIEAMNQGLGDNSPAVKAAQNIQTIGTALQGFLSDTAMLAGTGSSAYGAAQSSALNYAVSLLQTAPVLTTVQTALLTLRGNAQQLQQTLQDLGMTSTQAAASIASGVKAALAQISTTFTQGLQAQINTAQGKDYLNTTGALITSSVSNLNDAQLLGTDPKQVALAFQTQAQQIVDSAGLVGASFQDFINQFPQLAGVVHVSTTALQTLTAAQTAAQTAQLTAQTNYDTALRAEQTTALTAQATAQTTYYNALRTDQTTALTAQTTAQTRLTTAQTAAVAAVQSLADATTQFYSGLQTTISTYLHGLNTGSSSLSPQAALTAAQSDYNAQLTLAQSGDRTALGSITTYSTDLLTAAKNYFASSSGYQTILDKVETELTALPALAQLADPIVAQLQQANAFLAQNNMLTVTGNTNTSTGNTIASTQAELISAQNAMVGVNNALAVANNALTANGLSLTVSTNATLDAQTAWSAANASLLAANNALTANGLSLTSTTNAVLDAQNALVTANNALTIANNALATAGNTSTADSAASLSALQALQTATTQSSVNISASVTQLGAQGAFVADTQGSQYFGPMNQYLAQIAANTLLSGSPASAPSSKFVWYNPFTWFHEGGIVGGYAPGGIVGNGLYNIDSVRARYAGGGDILLGGGEAVTRATSVNPMTMPMLDHINRNGSLPSNDNGKNFQDLGSTLVRAMAGVSMAETGAMRDNIDALRSDIQQLAAAMKTDKTRPRVPGTSTMVRAA